MAHGSEQHPMEGMNDDTAGSPDLNQQASLLSDCSTGLVWKRTACVAVVSETVTTLGLGPSYSCMGKYMQNILLALCPCTARQPTPKTSTVQGSICKVQVHQMLVSL